ncbi:6-phosphogluconolactonase [Leptospira inadai serovar Lyme str. 10]|uniref:6-phosphogluconolactonase n=1 Tax=Leptospira inadai serovar Lyme str. 10 TaxID=1049790 RepID=V6HCC7_9LEPT|nr:6-phosphogluconolactonase [Leptospira inadai]EQA36483.1 6-phosphogluconolactonase [Leptospira inadai serovar Lyme str. 10]
MNSKHFREKGEYLIYSREYIKYLANRTIQSSKEFHIVLAGGETPREIYKYLREIDTDWSKWIFWFGDERCLPIGHSDRNSTMAEESLFNSLPIDETQIKIIPAQIGAVQAAEEYSSALSEISIFDLVLLGIGEDGHTASLFPGNNLGSLPQSPSAIPVLNAPKFPKERVSLSLNRLNRSKEVLFLVSGKEKGKILERISDREDLPFRKVKGSENTKILYWNGE